jgi:hypothetical protein
MPRLIEYEDMDPRAAVVDDIAATRDPATSINTLEGAGPPSRGDGALRRRDEGGLCAGHARPLTKELIYLAVGRQP